MKLILNEKEVCVNAQQISIAELTQMKDLPSFGVAIAVNNKVIRKTDWETTFLRDGDNVTVITAVCGG